MISLARVLVRLAIRRAERAIDRVYDFRPSRKIDRLQVALEALSE